MKFCTRRLFAPRGYSLNGSRRASVFEEMCLFSSSHAVNNLRVAIDASPSVGFSTPRFFFFFAHRFSWPSAVYAERVKEKQCFTCGMRFRCRLESCMLLLCFYPSSKITAIVRNNQSTIKQIDFFYSFDTVHAYNLSLSLCAWSAWMNESGRSEIRNSGVR